MAIEIRLSQESDFKQLVDLDHSVWDEKTTPSIIKWESTEEYSKRNPAGSQIVAIIDGKIQGYLGFHHPTPLEANKLVYEIDIAVNKQFQGKGVGRYLLEGVKQMAREQSIKKLSLRVLASNEGAISFYKKCGFQEQGRLIREFFINGHYVDDVLMFCLLTD